MTTATENTLRFVPSRVEGLPSVTEVIIFPDRLELFSADAWEAVPFLSIARWNQPAWLNRPLARLGIVRCCPSVADRDWFHAPAERFFRFYTQPTITIYLTAEPDDLAYAQTMFRRVQEVIEAGGYATLDLG